METVTIIIPAYQEENKIGNTLSAIRDSGRWYKDLIVIDDGSTDSTYVQALKWTPHVLQFPHNQGKARALEVGVKRSKSDIVLFLDADLEQSARHARSLVEPIWKNEADMTIACLPRTSQGGFGLVKKFASWGIYRHTGVLLREPLGGQRALRREDYERCYQGDRGFGVEVGLSVDCLKANLRIKEIDVNFTHRQTGKNISGFVHRFKQGMAVLSAFQSRK